MRRNGIARLIILLTFFAFTAYPQSFMMQGWYWDYPKDGCNSYTGSNWAAVLNTKVAELKSAGFDYIWLPPLPRASFGQCSNGYDPKDLYDLGEYSLGRTGFGTRAEVDALITSLTGQGIKPVSDMVYNHRDGGGAENNSSVEGWIENFTSTKVTNGDNAYPSDRFRCVLPIGGATGRGAGTYYFKIKSASGHSNYYLRKYKVYMWTEVVGWQALSDVNEVEPNGGGDCGEADNVITLGRNYWAFVDNSGCGVDEFALTLGAGDFNAAGDNIYITMPNDGSYSDHYIYGIWYTVGAGSDVQSALKYQTYTDFSAMPSAQGSMSYLNFKPNGNATQLSGDWDWMYFYYDYDQTVASTKTALYDWTKWLWNSVGIRGFRMDAVKHFPPEFVGDLLDNLHTNAIDPTMIVGEFYDANTASLKNWIDQVYVYMDAATKLSIVPRIFDFSLRDALKKACDTFGYDVRNVFTSSLVDAQGMSGLNVVTFASNHDFRDAGQYIANDPILANAYILTNNQIGIPCIYYPDYYTVTGYPTTGYKADIDELMQIHKDFIFGAANRDYLTSATTTYNPFYTTGTATTTLVYQLRGQASGKDVLVAINFAGTALDMWVGVNSAGLLSGATLGDQTGNATSATLTVGSDLRVNIKLPARSYGVWVEDATPLPVELTSFSAETQNGSVMLRWGTATEVNNYGFEIERREKPQAGKDPMWETISFVPGNGNSNSPKKYSYTDTPGFLFTPQTTLLYRLKQIDNDGTATYSETVEVSGEALPQDFALYQNYPNPFNPSTLIPYKIPYRAGAVENGNYGIHVKLSVYDILGNEVARVVDEQQAPGYYEAPFDASKLPSGVYFYRIEADRFSQFKKLLFLK